MVRKGSPVRVRQRAFAKSPLVGDFRVLGRGRGGIVAEHLRNTLAAVPVAHAITAPGLVFGGGVGTVRPTADALDVLHGVDPLRPLRLGGTGLGSDLFRWVLAANWHRDPRDPYRHATAGLRTPNVGLPSGRYYQFAESTGALGGSGATVGTY